MKDHNEDKHGGEEFSLEEILAEYATHKTPQKVVPLPQESARSNVISFPGTRRSEEAPPPVPDLEPEDEEDEEDEDDTELEPPEDFDEEEDAPDNLIRFPDRPRGLRGLLRSLSRRADDYAEHMFEAEDDMDPEEIRRMEELIPGVDREDVPMRRRRPRRQDPPEPDTPPVELARGYGKGLSSLRTRSWLVLLLFLAALYPVVQPVFALPLPALPDLPMPLERLEILASGCALAFAMLLCMDMLTQTLGRLLRLRVGMDTLLLCACGATLADALTMSTLAPRAGQMPYCAINILGLYLALRGCYHRRVGLRMACRTAAAAANPYLVTLDEGKWNGRDTYAKHSAPPDGFGSQIQADDGAQRIFRIVCPLLLVGCVALSLTASVGIGEDKRLLWCLSATFTASAALAAPLCFAAPFSRLSRRLAQCGAALAGWPGATGSKNGNGILLTDTDLFPPGAVTLNGIHVFGDFSEERVIGYTATLIRASGCGLEQLFHDLLRAQGAIFRQAGGLCCYEGGGVSANIRGDSVLVGSAAFMNLMEIPLPQGLSVKNAVFCAIEGELAGIFALNYTLPDLVFPSVGALLQEKLSPVLATRDFNLIPSMLQQRFKLAADRMDYPPVERRRELSDPEQVHSSTLTAVLCREGIYPYSEAVVGARRLRRVVRLNALLCCVGSAIGLALAHYLTGVGAFASLSPVNLLIYLVLWAVPAWFISRWVDQF